VTKGVRRRSYFLGVLGTWVAITLAATHSASSAEKAGALRPDVKKEREEKSPHLFRKIGGDFQSLFTSETNFAIVGAGLGASLVLMEFDPELTRNASDSVELNGFFRYGDVAGEGFVHTGGALSTWLLGKLIRKRGVEDLGRDLISAQVLAQTMTHAIKQAVNRTRPDGAPLSFPSGHTSTAYATASVLHRRYGWKAGVPAFALAAYVAGSRVQDRRHFPSDIVFGATLGVVAGRSVRIGNGNHRLVLLPLVRPDGAGVQVTLFPAP